jgi:hypothetical protein
MKKLKISDWFHGARKRAAHANSGVKKVVSCAVMALLLTAVLYISGCVGATGASKPGSSEQTTPGAASISVTPASIHFGSVAVDGMASQSVTITNGGGSTLTVTQADTTAAGVRITGISLPLTIQPGKQATFNAIFSPKAAGALSGVISVMSDLSSSPSTVSLSGTALAAKALLTTNSTSLNFGNVTIGKSGESSLTLTNAGNSDVTISKVSITGARYSITGVSAGLILAPGQSATLDATFSPLAAGSLPGSVVVDSNATDSPVTISLSGDGTQTSSHSVTLTWIPTTSPVAGYYVYRSETSGGPYAKLNSSVVATDSYTDHTVQPGQTYYFVVTSVTAAGVESGDSTQVSATVPTL